MEKIAVDYFALLNQDYLFIVDYFPKYPEVISLSSKTAGVTIKVMQLVLSRLGIPDTIVADNMPFNSAEFKDFEISPLSHQIRAFHNPMAWLREMFRQLRG